jgi:DNA (cytosine-5)-methyltransferase 1
MADIANTLKGNSGRCHIEDNYVPMPVAFVQNTRDEVRLFGGDGHTVGALVAQPGMKQQTYIAFSCKDHGADAGPISPTLRSMGHDGSHANAGGQVAIAVRTAQTSAHGHGIAMDVSHTLDQANGQAVCFESRFARNGRGAPDTVVPPLKAQSGETGKGDSAPLVTGPGMAVRRLTPRECERLQGFPDDYTLVPFRKKLAADGPRYKAIGNSMAVPVMRWIGERIQRFSDPNFNYPPKENHDTAHQEAQEVHIPDTDATYEAFSFPVHQPVLLSSGNQATV